MILENIKDYKCFDILNLKDRYYILNKAELCIKLSKIPHNILNCHFYYNENWYKKLKLCKSGTSKNSDYCALSYYPIDKNNKTVCLKRGYIIYFCNNLDKTIIKGYEIDHIDRNPLNDNLSNLRYVTKLENMQNRNLSNQKTKRRKTMNFNNDIPKYPLSRSSFRSWCKNRNLDINDYSYKESEKEYWLISKRDGYIKKYYWKLKTTKV